MFFSLVFVLPVIVVLFVFAQSSTTIWKFIVDKVYPTFPTVLKATNFEDATNTATW